MGIGRREPAYPRGNPEASAQGQLTVLRGNSGPVTEIQKQPVMSVPSRPQTKDSRNSERGPLLSGMRREAAPRKEDVAGLANRGKHSVLGK